MLDYFKQHFENIKNLTQKLITGRKQNFKLVWSINHFEICKTSNILNNLRTILVLKQFYCWIYESVKILEACFGWSLLAMVTYTFIDLTSNLYWFFVAFLKIDKNANEVDCVLKTLSSVVTITCLIHSSYKIGMIYLEQINLALKLQELDKNELTMLTKEFLIQVYNEKIEYSANDFFMVDFKLLFGVSIIKIIFFIYI